PSHPILSHKIPQLSHHSYIFILLGIIERDGDKVTVRFNWNTLSFRYKTNYSYFGMSRYVIDFSGDQPKILSKYVVLKNDYINQVIDIYHL
ncbi:aromatic-ring-hydroxylating dioxygenase subunit beta, partial [Acinetobacter baumannii]|uniref:aromatic-ring-hydroxylating dioxygenase subunit beta n=1 Tax=Acinetobacter baumannii TaxID=470 RepID=UPI00387B8C8D